MRHALLLALLLPTAAVCNATAATAQTMAPQPVIVDSVLDGDTVVVRGWTQRVRLANLDAPEMSHRGGKPGQPYGRQARDWLAAQVQGQAGVTAACHGEDRYGRAICDFYRQGVHVNKQLVRIGLAWANTANKRYLRDRSVLDAQHEAQAARRGLWSQPGAAPPWEWRRAGGALPGTAND